MATEPVKADLNRRLPQLVKPEQIQRTLREKLHAGQTPLPETWVSLRDSLVGHVHKFKEEEPDTSFFILIRDKPPAPKESKYTVLGTASEVYKIHRKNSPVRARLEEWMDLYRAQYAMGKISDQSMAEKEALYTRLLERYQEHVNQAIEWYFDRFFRVFDDRTLEEIEEDVRAAEEDA